MGPILRSLFMVGWFIWAMWMASFSMYLSCGYALLMLWAFSSNGVQKVSVMKRWSKRLIIFFSPMIIWNVGLVEYAKKSIDLDCRVLGYTGQKAEPFCSLVPESYNRGRNHKDGPLFSSVEHIGVHGFNMMLATGGFFSGLPQVAWETFYMSFAANDSEKGMANESKELRLKQCYGGGEGQKKSLSTGNGAFMLTSSTVRKAIAKHVNAAKRVTKEKPKRFPKIRLHFVPPGGVKTHNNDNTSYGNLMRSDNFKVPITLVAPDGYLHLEAQYGSGGPEFDVMWEGSIAYPHNSRFQFALPTIWQHSLLQAYTGITEEIPLLVSETVFCGMTIDGAMNAYTQRWRTTISVEDPRLSKEGQLESEKSWIESLLIHVM